jgi:hypothetical protein
MVEQMLGIFVIDHFINPNSKFDVVASDVMVGINVVVFIDAY